jgi:hypothetical protein
MWRAESCWALRMADARRWSGFAGRTAGDGYATTVGVSLVGIEPSCQVENAG